VCGNDDASMVTSRAHDLKKQWTQKVKVILPLKTMILDSIT
jgi:hypothetical protein